MRRRRHPTIQALLPAAAMAVYLMQPAAVHAEQSFHDRARVVAVTPVEVRPEGARVDAACGPAREWAGPASYPPGMTIARALREDLERVSGRARCSALPARATVYRVRYEYGGQTHERRMAEDPGEWVDVRVRLTPR